MKTLGWFVCVAMMLGLAVTALADNEGYVIQAAQVEGIVVDGNPADWDQTELDLQPIGWYHPDYDPPADSSDLSAGFTVGWNAMDSDTLYVLITVVDQDIVLDPTSRDTGDRVEFYTDFPHTHGSYDSPFDKQQWVLIPDPANPGRVFDRNGTLDAPHNSDGTVNLSDLPSWGVSVAYSLIDGVSFYEMAIPAFLEIPQSASTLRDLTECTVIGVDAAVVDNDTTGGESFTRATWSPGGGKWEDASMFGNAVMVSMVGGPKVTDVHAWFEGASPGWEWNGAPGDTVWISARVTHPDGVVSVTAEIDTTGDGMSDLWLYLEDDGLHKDGAQGDDVYGGFWKTRAEMMEYHGGIEAGTYEYSSRYCDVVWFSTVNYPPDVHWLNVDPDQALQGANVNLEASLSDRDGVDSVFVVIERHEDATRDSVFLSFDRFDEDEWRAIFKGTWIAGSPGGYTAMLSACDSTGVWFRDEHHREVNVVDMLLGTPDHRGIITAPGDTTVKVPLCITDVTGLGILSVELGIDYNPEVLAIPESGFIQTAGTLTEGWAASWDTLNFAPGTRPDFPLYQEGSSVRIAMMGVDSLDSAWEDSILVYLVFDIADGAHHGYETRLWNNHLLVNEEEVGPSTGWMEGGVTIGEYGDVNKSGKSSEFDAALLLMHAVGIIDLHQEGWQQYILSPPDSIYVHPYTADVADVTGNGQPTAYDGAHILQYSVDIIDHFPAEAPYWPWNNESGLPKPAAPAARQIMLADMRSSEEGIFVLPIHIDEMDGVLSGQMTLSYDSNRWKALGVEKADLLEDGLFAGHVLDGEVRIAFARKESRKGAGDIALIRFRALKDGRFADPGFALDAVQLNEGIVPVTVLSSLGATAETPSLYRLGQNYPNPFNPETVIGFDLSEEGMVCLAIYNQVGQKIRTLVDEHRFAGSYSVVWDGKDNRGRDVASGVYFYHISVNGFVQAKKLVVIQ